MVRYKYIIVFNLEMFIAILAKKLLEMKLADTLYYDKKHVHPKTENYDHSNETYIYLNYSSNKANGILH